MIKHFITIMNKNKINSEFDWMHLVRTDSH